MKLFEIANNLFEGIVVYHGTDQSFDKFDLEKVGSSDGRSIGGWGIYFSEDAEICQQYITGQGKIKEYELGYGNFFDLDDMLSSGTGDIILRGLNRKEVDENEIEEFESDFMNEYLYDTSNKQAYEWLGYVLGGEKEASLFLKDLGYDGNVYKDKTNPEINNYAVYNSNIIRN